MSEKHFVFIYFIRSFKVLFAGGLILSHINPLISGGNKKYVFKYV